MKLSNRHYDELIDKMSYPRPWHTYALMRSPRIGSKLYWTGKHTDALSKRKIYTPEPIHLGKLDGQPIHSVQQFRASEGVYYWITHGHLIQRVFKIQYNRSEAPKEKEVDRIVMRGVVDYDFVGTDLVVIDETGLVILINYNKKTSVRLPVRPINVLVSRWNNNSLLYQIILLLADGSVTALARDFTVQWRITPDRSPILTIKKALKWSEDLQLMALRMDGSIVPYQANGDQLQLGDEIELPVNRVVDYRLQYNLDVNLIATILSYSGGIENIDDWTNPVNFLPLKWPDRVVRMCGEGPNDFYLTADGEVFVSGYNGTGELGLGRQISLVSTNYPVKIPIEGVVDLSQRSTSTYFLLQ